MNHQKTLTAIVVSTLLGLTPLAGSQAQPIEVSLDANDAVYDATRDVIYVSTASTAGFPNGNSILTLDPSTLAVIDQINAGSEPSQMEISLDDSRVYLGIDGARAFRYS